MTISIAVHDELRPGQRTHSFRLELTGQRLSACELITRRVKDEVERVNRERPVTFRMLVQPTDAEVSLNGYALRPSRPIDWKVQVEKACEAFERNGFLLLVDNRQVESLEEELTLRSDSEVTFLKLVPLVGG